MTLVQELLSMCTNLLQRRQQLVGIGGAAGDHFGRRRLLVAGIAIFTLVYLIPSGK